VSTSIKRDSDI